MQVKNLKRKFVISEGGKDIQVDDPNPRMSIDEVKKHLSLAYPSLINAKSHESKIEEGFQVYIFKATFGDKG